MATVRALAVGGYRPYVVVSGRRSAATLSQACAGVLRLPPVASPDYAAALRRELARRRPLAVFAASDAALVSLGSPGVHLIDKRRLPAIAAAAGLEMPETRSYAGPEDLLSGAGDLDYPVVIKSGVKLAARSVARRVDSPEAVRRLAGALTGPLVVQPFHTEGMRAVAGVIHGGRLAAVVHQAYLRIWPVDCGVACAAVTTSPDRNLEDRLPTLLSGYSGVFQVQLVGQRLIDVNPRVYGSLPLAVAAGANLPALACAALQGGSFAGPVRGAVGVRYRWLEGDLRRIVHDVRGGRLGGRQAAAALRPRRGTAHSVESLRDPLPVLSRLVELGWRR